MKISRPPHDRSALSGDPQENHFRNNILPLIILIFVAALAYANAWPNELIWDDKVFLVGDRLLGISFSDIQNYFTEDVWATVGANSGLYRPLFLLSVALDIEIFGKWLAGYHLVNIFLHVLVSLLVFGFVRYLLLGCGNVPRLSGHIALLAALVFAVHPIHTEVVNSIFNRSEMLASLGIVGGLWWFLKTVDDHPWKAWGLLGPIYLLVMLCRETGAMLPAITVVFLWILTPGNWRLRFVKCLPVIWLLAPLAIYLGLRAYALEAPLPVEDIMSDRPPPRRKSQEQELSTIGLFYDFGNLVPAVQVWFDSIRLMLWPDPLLTFHNVSTTNIWIALFSQLALVVFALIRLLQKKPGLMLGLAFFYLSMLPSSRILGEFASFPFLAERNLYMPSIGMTIVLAFSLMWLTERFRFKVVLVMVLAVLMLMTPLTWARNTLWTSNVRLAMADYYGSGQSGKILPTLIKALIESDNLGRAERVCDNHTDDFLEDSHVGGNCAQVYATLGRYESAEETFLLLINNTRRKAPARFGLAVMYLDLGRRDEAKIQFEQAISEEKQLFIQEYRTATMLLKLYPSERDKALEAKAHLEKSLELEPRFYLARRMLDRLDRRLEATDKQQD